MTKRFLIGLCKYGLGFGLLAYVIWSNWSPSPDGKSPGIADVLQQPVHWNALIYACLFCTAGLILTYIRWYVLVRAQEMPFTVTNAIRLGSIGFALSTFLPGSVGGDIIKAVCIAREQSRRTVAVATVVVDRVVGLWGLFWLVAILGCIFWLTGDTAFHDHTELQTLVVIVLTVVLVSILAWCMLLLLPTGRAARLENWLQSVPRLGPSLAELWRAVWMYRNQWRSVVLALLMSVVGHVGFVLTFYFSARTFINPDQLPSLTEHFLIVPIGMTIQAAFPAPGGVGGGEYGFGALYRLIGSPAANGVIGSLTQRMIFWGLALIGYLLYLRMPRAELAVATLDESPDAEEVAKKELVESQDEGGTSL